MIELARHIEVLLLENDCVIVPGLGGFVTHHVSARFVSEEGRFLPPYRTLGFSPKMQLNDGLLVQSYMQAYDATYPEALRIVEQKAQEVRDALATDGQIELHGIGTLYQNIVGEYTFTPLESGLLSPNLYGFSSFDMPTLQQLEEKEAQERIAPLQPMQVSNTPKAQQEKKTVVIQMNYTWAVSIAAACIGIIFCLLITLPSPTGTSRLAGIKPITEWFNKASKEEVKVNKVSPKADRKLKPTTAEKPKAKAPEKTEETRAAEKTVDENQNQKVVEAKAEKPGEYYTLVLVSCVPKANAKRFVDELNAQGLKDAQILVKNDITRVTYAKFSSEAEAINQLRVLRKESVQFSDCWVLKVK